MLRRRDLARWGISAWLAGSQTAVWSQKSSALRAAPAGRTTLGPVVLAAHQRPSLCFLPLTIADRLGFFAAEGLSLRVLELGSPEQVVQALLSGAAQVASGSYSQTVDLQLRGHEHSAFVMQGRTPQLVLGVSLRTLANFRQIGDLRGRRMAVASLGSAGHRMARLVLGKSGLGPQDVSFQAFDDATAARSAVALGQVDALCYHDPLVTQLEQDGALRVVVDTRTVRGTAEVFGGPLPSACLFASSAVVQQRPEQCQAMANAMVRALKWLQTAGPSDLIRTVPEHHFAGDRSLYLAAFTRTRESWVPDGLMPEDGPQTLLRNLTVSGDAPQLQRVDLAKTYTNRFALEAKSRYRV